MSTQDDRSSNIYTFFADRYVELLRLDGRVLTIENAPFAMSAGSMLDPAFVRDWRVVELHDLPKRLRFLVDGSREPTIALPLSAGTGTVQQDGSIVNNSSRRLGDLVYVRARRALVFVPAGDCVDYLYANDEDAEAERWTPEVDPRIAAIVALHANDQYPERN